jgi:hypothetical protein
MADIRQSLFQKPDDRIKSITQLNKMIADSKEVKEWDLQINLEPDQIEAKVLRRPGIILYPSPQAPLSIMGEPLTVPTTPVQPQTESLMILNDTNVLREIVC